jgi:5'-nucleotidase (lipoprotein e(P4) family)
MKASKNYLMGLFTGVSLWAVWAFMPSTPAAPAPQHSGTYLELATNYHQNAAEYRALCYQAYNLATQKLDNLVAGMRRGPGTLPPAVVVDIDETVLDNSPYQGQLVREGGVFPMGWEDWCNLKTAKPVPGALEFLQNAHSKGVTVFYITNRKKPEWASTIANLRQLGFPDADSTHVLYRTSTGDKTERRNRVAQTHLILMYCGDNLGDFSGLFDKQSTERRFAVTDSLRRYFGETYFVLPNPMYGDWVGALINFDYSSPWQEQQTRRLQHIRGFRPE